MRCQTYKAAEGTYWHVGHKFAGMINDYLNQFKAIDSKLLEWVMGEVAMVIECGKQEEDQENNMEKSMNS